MDLCLPESTYFELSFKRKKEKIIEALIQWRKNIFLILEVA